MRRRDGRGLRAARDCNRTRHDERPSIAVLGKRAVLVRWSATGIAGRSRGPVRELTREIPPARAGLGVGLGLGLLRGVHRFAVLGAGHVALQREVREAGELRAETQHRKPGRGKPGRTPSERIL